MCHLTPQGYKEPFEQMESNSCKLGVVPNVHGADVRTRVPQSEIDLTLGRPHISVASFGAQLHSYRDVCGLCFPAPIPTLIHPKAIVTFVWQTGLYICTSWTPNFSAAAVRLCLFCWRFLLKHGDNSTQRPQPHNQPVSVLPFNSDKLQQQQHAEYLMRLRQIAAECKS